MNQVQGADIESPAAVLLDETRGPVPQDDRVAEVSWPARLYASKHARRLVPAPLALGLAASVGPAVRQRRNPGERFGARQFMTDLLLYTPRAGEAEQLAERWLIEKSQVRELFWRPWLLKNSRVSGTEHWDAAHAGGQGCVIVFGHFGAAWAVPAILGLRGFQHYLVVSPHYWEPMPPGYEGLAILHRRREYGEKVLGNTRLVPSNGRPSRLLDLLHAGESVALAFDVPGWAATPFLGRMVALGGGPATLAAKAKARVLPVTVHRHGARLDLSFLPPLDPATIGDPMSLRAEIARTFEPIVLAHPETVELPWYPSPLVTEVELQNAAVGAEPDSSGA